MLGQKLLGGGLGGLVLIRGPQQHALGREQASPIPPRLVGQKSIEVLKAGQVLLAFDHAFDFLEFIEKISAAKLDFFARAAGTERIGVESHEDGGWLEDGDLWRKG
jgi:hypothetical protein